MLKYLGDFIEALVRCFILFITDFLPVKVVRDEKGVPFLYKYHILSLYKDGPGICIHHFVKSDPERGYHDHPWKRSFSFILCGGYEERIFNLSEECGYIKHDRPRFTFNYLDGVNVFHRVMIEEGKDAWTLFFFQKRSKPWGMISLKGGYKAMNPEVVDRDGDWWKTNSKGLSIHEHMKHPGKVFGTVDMIIISKEESKILLIQRGKNPYKDYWAFPGGRIEQKDADIEAAAYRELQEETSLTYDDVKLKHMKTIGNNTRDERGFCITNVFLGEIDRISDVRVRAGDDAVNYEWFDVTKLPELMAFDHKEIFENLFS